jgi:hypothetical protein
MMATRHPPLWARWLLSILGFAALIALISIAVRGQGGPSQPDRSAEVEADREGQIVIAQDQAPHNATLHAGIHARVALELAITADVRDRIRNGQLAGDLQSVRCRPARSPHAGRRAYRCTARVANIAYPFLGAADEHARSLTWCKRDPPPSSNAPLAVPVNPGCLR